MTHGFLKTTWPGLICANAILTGTATAPWQSWAQAYYLGKASKCYNSLLSLMIRSHSLSFWCYKERPGMGKRKKSLLRIQTKISYLYFMQKLSEVSFHWYLGTFYTKGPPCWMTHREVLSWLGFQPSGALLTPPSFWNSNSHCRPSSNPISSIELSLVRITEC